MKNKNLRTNFNRFLMSLCASDLVSACICSPLWLYRRTWGFSEWNLGPAMCKFYWVSDFATDFTTSLHILSFCLLRFFAISFPFTAPTTRFKSNKFRLYIASLWFLSLLLAAPHAYFMDVRQNEGTGSDKWPSCSIDKDKKHQYHIYSVVVYSLFFYVPAVLIIILSFITTRNLLKMTQSAALSRVNDAARASRIRRRNKAACLQLRLICASFTFGYVLVAAYLIWTSANEPDPTDCRLMTVDYWFGVTSYLLLRISECVNPVMYNLGCSEMRASTFDFVKHSVFRRASRVARAHSQQRERIFTIFHSRSGAPPEDYIEE
ncbi:growth hormone secretagogue receptor type 1-like isoform X2 [Styela clava]|nr:growth hormone secretagogue receptor type 1-like isoform X2 [Styela clava]